MLLSQPEPWTRPHAQALAGLRCAVHHGLPFTLKIDANGQPGLGTETEQLELGLLEGAAFATHPNQHLADEYPVPHRRGPVRVAENGRPRKPPQIDFPPNRPLNLPSSYSARSARCRTPAIAEFGGCVST